MVIKFYKLLCVTGLFFLISCKSSSPEADWKKVQPGSLGLSMEAPFEFREKNMESQLTPSVKKLIKRMETYFNEGNGNYYAISMVEYADDVNFNMEAAVNGSVNEMSMKAGGKISDRKDEMKTINGNEASITRATFSDKKENKMELQMAILTKGQRMYQVMGLYKPGSNQARENTNRMLESIIIH